MLGPGSGINLGKQVPGGRGVRSVHQDLQENVSMPETFLIEILTLILDLKTNKESD